MFCFFGSSMRGVVSTPSSTVMSAFGMVATFVVTTFMVTTFVVTVLLVTVSILLRLASRLGLNERQQVFPWPI